MVIVSIEEMRDYASRINTDPTFTGAYLQSLHKVLYLNQFQPLDLRKKYCKEVFMTMPEVIYMKKDFYLLDELNEKIELMKAAGLIKFWSFRDIDKNKLNAKETTQPKILTLNHFNGCFWILTVGAVISLVIFLLEICTLNFKTQV